MLPCPLHDKLPCLQTPQGWTLSLDCSTFPEDSWGLLLPQLRTLLQRWPTLSAAEHARKQPPPTVICSRKGEDQPLAALAAKQWPAGDAAAAASSHDSSDAASASTDAQEADSNSGAATAEAFGESVQPEHATSSSSSSSDGSASVCIDKLVLELGWEVFRPRPTEDEEEEDPPVVDFTLTLYNLQVKLAALLIQSPALHDTHSSLTNMADTGAALFSMPCSNCVLLESQVGCSAVCQPCWAGGSHQLVLGHAHGRVS